MTGFFSSLLRCGGRAGFEAEAVVPGFEDVAVMGEAIEEGGGHLGIAGEDAGPFGEGEVGRDDDRGLFVEAADEVEEDEDNSYYLLETYVGH